MKKIFSVSEYFDLEVQFLIAIGEDQWHAVWQLQPEQVTLVEMNSCIVCEIASQPSMEDSVRGFKEYLNERGYLKSGMTFMVKVTDANNQGFVITHLEIVAPGVMLCLLCKENIALSGDVPAKGNYSDEEEAFFSLFNKEVHS